MDESHSLWYRPLPGNRRTLLVSGETVPEDTITYGTYFTSVLRFCAHNGYARVLGAVGGRLKQPVAVTDIQHLSIFLEKHGAFYHPARLTVQMANGLHSFAVNVAASESGRLTLPREVEVLGHLATHRPFGWVPAVYAADVTDPPMFLADWLEGFHEFHLTRKEGDGSLAIVVWDGADKRRLLSETEIASLYREIAMILTAFYDPVTSRRITSWHHGAGDFVVRPNDERTAVRLITARDYTPISGTGASLDDEKAVLDALVRFFIHLSIHIRLDRVDGISDLAWASDGCLVHLVTGFFQGLDLTARISGFPENFTEIFRSYLGRHDGPALLQAARQWTAAAYDQRSEERRVVDENLSEHVSNLIAVISTT